MTKIGFETLLGKHKGKDVLIYCPGKNIAEWQGKVNDFIDQRNPVVIGSNKIMELIVPTYHIFLNNDKYQHYGHMINEKSTLMLGKYIKPSFIRKHKPKSYIYINYTDRNPSEKIDYTKHVVRGFYRTSGNLAIMLSHLMGAKNIYIAGMSGFSYKFDGDIHYYKAELTRSDMKTKKEWFEKYDKPTIKCLKQLNKYGINFKIITPTLYEEHYDKNILS